MKAASRRKTMVIRLLVAKVGLSDTGGSAPALPLNVAMRLIGKAKSNQGLARSVGLFGGEPPVAVVLPALERYRVRTPGNGLLGLASDK